MDTARITRQSMTVVGLETPASNDNPSAIGALWGRWYAEGVAAKIAANDPQQVVAVYHAYEGDHTKPYRFLLGCATAADAPVPDGMVKREIPGGTFAHYVAEGEQPQALIETWMRIWGEPIERSFVADVELHDGRTPTKIEIHVGVNEPSA